MMNTKSKALKKKMSANEFERHVNSMEKGLQSSRAKRIKKGGFKGEKDYFEKARPFVD